MRAAEIEQRVHSLDELLNVVGAMRSLAALRMQEVRDRLPGMRQYAGVVDEALARAMPLVAASGEPREAPATTAAVLVFCSEHGFVGALNDRLLERAGAALRGPADRLLVVGTRGASVAKQDRLSVAWSTAMATKAAALVEVARRVAAEIDRLAGSVGLSRVLLVYAQSQGVNWTVAEKLLLPFDPGPYLRPGGQLAAPLLNLPPADLLERLLDELIFAEIMQAALESFASENGARLAAMGAAHDRIQDKLETLRREAWERRQEEITTELMDVVTGAEAMAQSPADR